jgi:diguanylate cyclase (GGDEF)-like protein/PAS domain S-box-containing protein
MDYSETKMAQLMGEIEALQAKIAEEGRYRSLVDDIIDTLAAGIVILDKNFRVVWVNRALERFLDLRRDKIIEQDKRELIREEIKYNFEDPEAFAETVLATYDNNTYVENFECHVLPHAEREERWLEHWSRPIRSGVYAGGRVELYYDTTRRKRAEEELAHMATHDALTGLPNRTLFNDRLNLELAHARRNQQMLAVMLLDLDYFKKVNDTLGHSMGDRLLQAVGDCLTSLLRKSDTVARMGGDEFMLIFPEITQGKDTTRIAARILEAIRKPFVLDDHEIHITTSVGIAIYPGDGEDAGTLMRDADIAMYRVKEQGRNNYQRYSSKGRERWTGKRALRQGSDRLSPSAQATAS